MTPESDTTTHYFWAFARNYKIADQNLTTSIRKGIAGVFGEDMVIFSAQQKAIDANPDKEFYNLNVDAGSVWARRQIDALIEKENAPQCADPACEAAE
jgi:vanillate O-demethylase monooxygenase subunit